MKCNAGRVSKGSPGRHAGKDTLGRSNSMNKDTEAGKSANCSGNCKEVLHSWIQQACGQRFGWRRGWAEANHDGHGMLSSTILTVSSKQQRDINLPVWIPILPRGASGTFSNISRRFTHFFIKNLQ